MVRPFVRLVAPNTRLRMAVVADAAFICELENDVDRKRLVGGVSGKSEDFYRKSLALVRDLRCLIVESLATGARIGRCGLLTDSVSDECDIHIVLTNDHCGRGLGSEVAGALIQLAAEIFPEKTLTAKMHPDNSASLAIIAKLAFLPSGTISSHSYDNGWLTFRLPPATRTM